MDIPFPNVHEMFIPDKGYMLFDMDLEGADARCVAAECEELGDPGYRKAFEKADETGVKIHAVNAINIFGKGLAGEDGKKDPYYTNAKKGIHATSYGATVGALVSRAGFQPKAAEDFQRNLFQTYPGIDWRIEHISHTVQTEGRISNPFGYRIDFFGRHDSVINNALAWSPQSTVAEVTYHAMRLIDANLPEVELLMQVHDSIVGQIPIPVFHKNMKLIHKIINDIAIPYNNPLVIPWGLKISDRSWGETKTMSWDNL